MSSMNSYQKYIHASRYARYLPDEKRRETWNETVSRYINFFKARHEKLDIPWTELEDAILNLEVMPSMRCLMTAGEALERDNVAGYNCSYVAVDNTRVFDEILYILMCGTGVGFSVERQYINKLPEVAEDFDETETTIRVADSKIGWAKALKETIGLLYQGRIPQWDVSKVRPAGAVLKTFGGRSSGSEPLLELFNFSVKLFQGAAGRKLSSIEVHDLVCKIAEVVVCGGVRRSALISLSNLTDQRMRDAKSGEWYYAEPQRALANNSVSYTERPDMGIFMSEWQSLYKSKAGERGIFSRAAANALRPDRREESDFGTNPCSEIVLRNKQFCNLSEVVVRPNDTQVDLLRKARLAAIIGTLQSGLDNFRYLSKQWTVNTREERLLGVSLTGICDHKTLGDYSNVQLPTLLGKLKDKVIRTNEDFASIMGIPPSTATTCVKPSGTVSQLVDCASGIHPRYSRFYARRVRGSINDPISSALTAAGVHTEVAKTNPTELVFTFPMQSPKNSTVVEDVSALEQLELWKVYSHHFCEHKPSISVYVKEHEWMKVGAWVYDNFDIMSGVSFFPKDDHMYPQAPYEELEHGDYLEYLSRHPKTIDLNVGEEGDNTTASQELACSGGACDL